MPTPQAPPTDGDLSLAWRTELMFARFDGEVVDRGNHLVVRTPTNPAYWWGNFLLFHHAPGPGDLERWMALFDEEIASRQPASRHRAFGVDVPARFELPPDFAAAGFELGEAASMTLTRDRLREPRQAWPTGAEFQVLDLARDGTAVVDLQVASAEARFDPADYRVFAQRQVHRYAAMQRAGLGHWLGLVAPVAGRRALVASCGLFRDTWSGEALGRFQFVATHPTHRRRGLCTALVHAACRHGFEAMDLHTLAMLANPADVAIGVYDALGFRRGASAWQIERAPR